MGRQCIVFRLPESGNLHKVRILHLFPHYTQSSCRYLTKLCDQVRCLISDEDGERIVWKHELGSGPDEQDSDDDNATENFDRLFTFKVAVTNEQEETATIHEGFKVGPFFFSFDNKRLTFRLLRVS